MKVGENGSIWVKRAPKTGDEFARWDAFKPDGSPFGAIQLPAPADIRSSSMKRLLVLERDSLDVPIIRWYNIN